jgi:hypothetical protein
MRFALFGEAAQLPACKENMGQLPASCNQHCLVAMPDNTGVPDLVPDNNKAALVQPTSCCSHRFHWRSSRIPSLELGSIKSAWM